MPAAAVGRENKKVLIGLLFSRSAKQKTQPDSHLWRFAGNKRISMDAELLYPEECHAIIGACFEVYNVMGCGFLESVYQKCLEREFTIRGIPFVAQQRIGLITRLPIT
jgi:hypothetical protein